MFKIPKNSVEMKPQPLNRLGCFRLLACLGLFITSAGMSFAEVTIAWDPNSEVDLDGYGIYVSKGSPGPPYEHLGDVFLDDLADPGIPSVKLTEIEADGKYYLAATAFDTQGDESEFSKALCVQVSGPTAAICESDSGGGGGGGGGGCLITSAGDRFRFSRRKHLLSSLSLSGWMKLVAYMGLIGLIGKHLQCRSKI